MRHTHLASHILYLAAATLLLAACAQPTTYSPSYTQAELAEEQKYQEAASKENPFEKIEGEVEVTSEMLARMERIEAKVVPQSEILCKELFGNTRPCEFTTEVSAEAKGINAFADGKRVVMGPTMMEFAKDDTQVAFVLSHELAHNIMKHPDAGMKNTMGGLILGSVIDAAVGGTDGTFGKLGAQAGRLQYSPDFETEADYTGLYILARAGYPIEKAPEFWRAMSQYDPQGIYARSTHPTNAERFVVMRKTINEIRSKQQLGMPLVPEFIPAGE